MTDDVKTRSTVYIILDKLTDDIACAFVAPNDAYAERQFLNLISSPDANVFSLNTKDFLLMKYVSGAAKVRAADEYAESLIHSLRAERMNSYKSDHEEKDSKNAFWPT